MNKKTWIIIGIIAVLLIGGGIFLYFRNVAPSPNESDYEANRTSSENTLNQTDENTTNSTNQEEKSSSTNETRNEISQGITEAENNNTPSAPKTKVQIATYTTKIYSKDSARQNNISITCKTLDGTTVKNGETFSFCNTIGPASTSKGYQKADIFDKNGNKKKGLGGRKLPN